MDWHRSKRRTVDAGPSDGTESATRRAPKSQSTQNSPNESILSVCFMRLLLLLFSTFYLESVQLLCIRVVDFEIQTVFLPCHRMPHILFVWSQYINVGACHMQCQRMKILDFLGNDTPQNT